MKQNKWVLIATGAVVAVVAFGAGTVIARSADKDEGKVLNGWAYQTCMLDNTMGKKDEDDKSGISTSDYYELAELKSIKLTDEDADTVEYYVNVYDADKTFMSAEKYTEDFTAEDVAATQELGGVYFKIEIVDTENEKVSFFEKFGLSDKVEVTLENVEE